MHSQLYSVVILLCLSYVSGAPSPNNDTILPLVLWHGMGDSCCFEFSLGSLMKGLETAIPGVYILSLKIGDTLIKDVENSFFLHPNIQVERVCNMIKANPALKNGFNAIGFSQGAQFLRAVVQRCKEAKIRNLISLGGQHQGVYGLPNCPSISPYTCDTLRKLLNHAAYVKRIQNTLVQATYWHDPLNESEYIFGSTFLSDINNERNVNQTYIERLNSLENFVLVKFDKDTMVTPKDTEWFEFYTPEQSVEITPLNESAVYDRLGLRTMQSLKKLHFLSVPHNHLQFDWEWFNDEIITKFLL